MPRFQIENRSVLLTMRDAAILGSPMTDAAKIKLVLARMSHLSVPGPDALSPEEIRRGGQIANMAARAAFWKTRRMLRTLLAEYLGLDGPHVTLASCSGRPVCTNRSAPGFSISRSGDWLAVALGDRFIGVDIEAPHQNIDNEPLIEAMFHPQERHELNCLEEPMRTGAIYSMWTQKEAYSKAIGLGGLINFAAVKTLAEGGPVVDLAAASNASRFFSKVLSEGDSLIIAVVSRFVSPVIEMNRRHAP